MEVYCLFMVGRAFAAIPSTVKTTSLSHGPNPRERHARRPNHGQARKNPHHQGRRWTTKHPLLTETANSDTNSVDFINDIDPKMG
jgi:hypothetical protein